MMINKNNRGKNRNWTWSDLIDCVVVDNDVGGFFSDYFLPLPGFGSTGRAVQLVSSTIVFTDSMMVMSNFTMFSLSSTSENLEKEREKKHNEHDFEHRIASWCSSVVLLKAIIESENNI